PHSRGHAKAGRQDLQGLLRRRAPRVQGDGLRRHGGAQVRGRVGRQGPRDRGRSAASGGGRLTMATVTDISLDPAELLAGAKTETCLSDWGDPTFEERFG